MIYVIIMCIVSLCVALFAVQNAMTVAVTFLAWNFTTSLVMVILSSLIAGLLIAFCWGLKLKTQHYLHEFVNTVKMDVFADEVFVFTPRGDVVDLPVGSVPVDFAYRIHTGVGNSCVGAKVNGRIVPLDYRLSNGDIVEVITAKQANGPSRDWLNFAGSSETKNKIKQWFKKERREENISKGREMLERDCKRLGYESKVLLTQEYLKEVANKVHIDGGEENLLAGLGYGGVPLNTVMAKLIDQYKNTQKKNTTKDLSQLLADLKPRTSKAKSSHGTSAFSFGKTKSFTGGQNST